MFPKKSGSNQVVSQVHSQLLSFQYHYLLLIKNSVSSMYLQAISVNLHKTQTLQVHQHCRTIQGSMSRKKPLAAWQETGSDNLQSQWLLMV